MAKVEELISAAKTAMLEGDDAAARLSIGTGCFVVVADLSMRIANTKVDIKMPDFWDVLRAASTFTGIGAVVGLVTGDLMKWWQDLIPKIDIEIGAGLWDWKYTCAGFGLLVAGVGVLIVNHPEWIESAIDRAQKLRETIEQTIIEILINAAGTEEGLKELDLPDLASLLGFNVGQGKEQAAKMIPGVSGGG